VPLFETTFEAGALMRAHPPRFDHPNKRAAFAAIDGAHAGDIRYARHRPVPLPAAMPASAATRLRACESPFDHDESAAWWLNFANADLFCMYGSGVCAQDEVQVIEHPALGAVREALLADRTVLRTVEGGAPTPVTVSGVERRGRLDIRALYGRRFAAAAPDEVVRAIERLDPPTSSRILAIEAPTDGASGRYTARQIERALHTA
jgi:hypothetical protein